MAYRDPSLHEAVATLSAEVADLESTLAKVTRENARLSRVRRLIGMGGLRQLWSAGLLVVLVLALLAGFVIGAKAHERKRFLNIGCPPGTPIEE
jgi:hypothetical protein